MPKLNANVVVLNEFRESTVLYAGDEIPDWAADQLGDHLIALSLPASKDVDNGEAPAPVVETAQETDPNADVDPDEEVEGYDTWSKEELKTEAKGRGLSGYSSLSKEELVSLLTEDDEIAAETDEVEEDEAE